MKLKQMLVTGTMVALTLLATAPVSALASSKDKTLNTLMTATPTTIDPAKASDVYSATVVQQVMEGIYTYDKNGKVAPGVAKKLVKPTNNGTKYVFDLRTDAKWSNGQAVTAQDFVAGLQHEVDPETKSQNASSYLSYIKNYAAVSKGEKPTSDLGVKALSKNKLEIDLEAATPYFDSLLATGFYPANQDALKQYGKDYAKNSDKMVYNGPYTLSGWQGTNDSWTYKKNAKFHDQKDVKIKKVVTKVSKEDSTSYNLFKSGKVQETAIGGQFVTNNKGNKELHVAPSMRISYLNYNTNKKPTNNLAFRRAFNTLLDRKSLTNSVLTDGSRPTDNMVPKSLVKNAKGKDFYDLNGALAKTDVKAAKSEWKKFQKETGTKNLTVNILASDDPAAHKVGEFIQSSAEKNFKGLKVTVTTQPVSQRIANSFAGKYDIALSGWQTGYPDPQGFLTVAQKTGTANFSKWDDAEFNSLMDKAATQNGSARWSTLAKANARLNSQVPDTPLYNQVVAHFVSKDVGGIKYTATTPEAYFQYAYWK